MNKIIYGIIGLVIIGGVVYFAVGKKSDQPTDQETSTNPSATQPANQKNPTPTPSANNANLKTYTSSDYGFEFTYPSSWKMVKELQASSADYLPGSRKFVAIYPTSYPAQDFSARIDVYSTSLSTVKNESPFLKSTSVSVNGISWTKIQGTDYLGNPVDSFSYLTERNGKTYGVGGSADLTNQILSKFKFTN